MTSIEPLHAVITILTALIAVVGWVLSAMMARARTMEAYVESLSRRMAVLSERLTVAETTLDIRRRHEGGN